MLSICDTFQILHILKTFLSEIILQFKHKTIIKFSILPSNWLENRHFTALEAIITQKLNSQCPICTQKVIRIFLKLSCDQKFLFEICILNLIKKTYCPSLAQNWINLDSFPVNFHKRIQSFSNIDGLCIPEKIGLF